MTTRKLQTECTPSTQLFCDLIKSEQRNGYQWSLMLIELAHEAKNASEELLNEYGCGTGQRVPLFKALVIDELLSGKLVTADPTTLLVHHTLNHTDWGVVYSCALSQ